VQGFLCKHCGIITERNPEIVPHPDKDEYYHRLQERYDNYFKEVKHPFGHYTILAYDLLFLELEGKYNHSITCPVCLNKTRFWRDEPLPGDKLNERGVNWCRLVF